MNFKTIANVVTSKAGRQLLRVQKHSPTLLFGAGVVGIVGTVVLASRATLKLDEVLDEHQVQLEKVQNIEHPSYSDEDRKKDQVLIYTRMVVKITKLYAPAFGLGVLSIAALTGSHVIMNRRLAGITAAYAAVDKAFKQYRARVVEEFGEDKDLEFRHASRDVELVRETDTGPQTEIVKRVDSNELPSMYAKYFDEGSPNWKRQPEYNLLFLRSQQNYANDLLKSRGHVFLNEVYDMLGLKRTSAGAQVGWAVGKTGDNYIDFGVFRRDREESRDFVNGWNSRVLLDFNVDGIIFDKIEDSCE